MPTEFRLCLSRSSTLQARQLTLQPPPAPAGRELLGRELLAVWLRGGILLTLLSPVKVGGRSAAQGLEKSVPNQHFGFH